MEVKNKAKQVMPSSSMMLVKLKDAIEFSDGCSMNTLPGTPAVGVSPPRPPRDTPEVVSL
jgi:hypothetical protein